MSQSYALEPELQSRTPRRIAARNGIRGGFGMEMGCLRLFLTPFILIGVFMITILLYRLALPVAAVTAPAVITSKDESSGEDGTEYFAHFRYTYQGQTYDGRSGLSWPEYSAVEVGQPGQAEFLPWLPGFHAQLIQPAGEPYLGSLLFLIAFNLIWNGGLSVFLFAAFVWPRIYRRLYTDGVPAMATITGKSSSTDDGSTTYTLTYEFPVLDPASHALKQIKGNTNVTQEAWNQVQVGDNYTVLYAPHKPKWNTLYRFGAYEVIG